jgi:Caspase domain
MRRSPALETYGGNNFYHQDLVRELNYETTCTIISNPGGTGAENYCRGVLKDVEHYRSFLSSAIGGAWLRSEIEEMSRPSVTEVRLKVKDLPNVDYVLVVFSGHGWHSTGLNSTALELRAGQEIDSDELRLATTKQTIILDCCREKHPGTPEVRALTEMLAKSASRFNSEDCRRYYDQRVQECSTELVVMYACSVDQKAADDDQKGGIYSYNLLEAGKDWADNSTVDTSRQYKILSVVQAHEATEPRVLRLRGTRQTPHIEKPRTGPYFPFGIVA